MVDKDRKQQVAHWQDARRQADIWHMIIKRATMSRLEHNYKEYFRCIDTIIPTLFKPERDLVKQYIGEMQPDNMLTGYDELLEHIIDVLEMKGYLSKKYAASSLDENIGDESLDGLETEAVKSTDTED